jgi:hypothetical protein
LGGFFNQTVSGSVFFLCLETKKEAKKIQGKTRSKGAFLPSRASPCVTPRFFL